MMEMRSSSDVLGLNNLDEFVHEFVEILEHQVSSSRMIVCQVVGRFPLPDVELILNIVSIVVEISFSYLDIVKSDAASQSSIILILDILVVEETDNFPRLIILRGQDFFFLEPGIVAFIGDGPRVVVGVHFVKVHGFAKIY